VPTSARFCGKCGCPIAFGPAENVEATIEPRQPAIPPPPPEPQTSSVAYADTAAADDDTVILPSQPQGARDPDVGSGVGRPVFLISVIVAAVVVGGIAAWLYMGQSAPPPYVASAPLVAAVQPPAPPPPPEPPASPPPTAAAAAVISDAPPLPAPTGQPFLPLLRADNEPPAAGVADAAREEEARAKAERARKRAEAKLARDALAAQQAREAALRSAEAAAPPPPSGPKEACAGESSFIARNSCEARVCQTREWMFHPYCMQRRQHEEQKRQGMFGRDE
jgi:hypothetical protein